MSVYYNSVGEGWFKKNKVVNESKYSVDDLNITYREKDVNGMKKFEIELDEMDENSKEVVSFLSKYLSKDDVYAAQDVIHDYIKDLKNKDVDEVYIAFESKEETMNEEITNPNEVNKIIKQMNSLNNDINKIMLDYNEYISFVNKAKDKLDVLLKNMKKAKDVDNKNMSLMSELMNNLKTITASKNIPDTKILENKIDEMYNLISDIFGYMD